MVFHHGTMDEADVSPGDDLVEEGFDRFWQAPPALSTPVIGGVHHAHVPAVMREDVVEDGMNADVPVMEPRRESAGASFLRLISLFMIGLEALCEEFLPAAAAFNIATFLSHDGLYVVVDGEAGQGLTADVASFGNAPEELVRRDGCVGFGENGSDDFRVQLRQVRSGIEWLTLREFVHVFTDGFVEVPAEGVGR